MNVRNGYGPVHHLVDETRRPLCGSTEQASDWSNLHVDEPISCPACFRLLADDARAALPSRYESED